MSGHRLLVVDDDLVMHRLFDDIGQNCGYAVEAVNTLESLSVIYQEYKPTLIFLDLTLGEGDGVEVMRFLSDSDCKCPIAIISSHDAKVRSSTLRLGESRGLRMDGSYQKPIDLNTVKTILNKYKDVSIHVDAKDIEAGIENREFVLHFQPKVKIETKEIIGAETLVRWQSSLHKTLLYPDAFIPVAEKSNLIRHLSRYIIEYTMGQMRDHGIDLQLSVNLSGRDLIDLSLPDEIAGYANKYQIEPSTICFEITETSVMSQPKIAMDILTRLRIHGFALSMDDFGIGYSSLIELHRMPFSELKIDKSFVIDLNEKSDALPIVRSIISLAKSMGLHVIAEGVETTESWDILEKDKCDYAQGYLISRPIEITQFLEFIKRKKISFNGK